MHQGRVPHHHTRPEFRSLRSPIHPSRPPPDPTGKSFFSITRRVLDAVGPAVPCISVLEGGYNREAIVDGLTCHLKALGGAKRIHVPKPLPPPPRSRRGGGAPRGPRHPLAAFFPQIWAALVAKGWRIETGKRVGDKTYVARQRL